MMEWTNEAKEKLHAQVERLLPASVDGNGKTADPRSDAYQDLLTDLKAHTEEELYEKGIHKIGSGDVESVLQGMGKMDDDTTSYSGEVKEDVLTVAGAYAAFPNRADYYPVAKKVKAVGGGFWFCLFGVFVPLLAVFGELLGGWCSDVFFNPMPTWVHAVLLILVPVSLLLGRHWLRNADDYEGGKFPYVVAGLLGFALPTVIYYAVIFIPTYPVAAIGVIFLVGFLVLSPLLSLMFLVRSWSDFKLSVVGRSCEQAQKYMKYGALAGFLTLLVIELPSYITQEVMPMLASEDAETQAEGVKMMRRYGGEEVLLECCYGGGRRTGLYRSASNPATWVRGFLVGNREKRMTSEQAREAYYRVTGVAFNTIEPPAIARRGMRFSEWDLEWDNDHGGDAVAGCVKGLSLHSSRLDMHLDGASKLGYTEWILEFKNDSMTEKEARMQIALPHGAVVSKLTLWVDGEERPAAFNTVSKVKAAYKKIAVVQRRDPVLVNVSGPDRVMLQCFPVPRSGGVMKTKIGITFPLHSHEGHQEGNVYYPYISERNFKINKGFKHEVYAQSAMSIRSPNAEIQETGDHSALIYSLENAKLKQERVTWKDVSDSLSGAVWTRDIFHEGEDKYLIRRSGVKQVSSHPLVKLIVVIDGSECMAKWKPTLVKMLEQGGDDFSVLVASDEVIPCSSARDLEGVEFIGGIDNVAALRQALAAARSEGEKGSAVMWLHGPQPVKFSSIAGLEQDVERSIVRVPIYTVALEDGENFVLKSFKKSPQFRGGCRVVNESDLTNMIDKVIAGNDEFSYSWDRQVALPTEGKEVWDQLARHWAYKKTMNDWLKQSNPSAELAAHYQLVTPVSGAVVLESLSQYIETGLEPPTSVGAPSIPGVPEPSSVLLLFIGLLGAAFHRNRR